jgi:quercetin dioxygenase-like cupin family protein
MPTLHTEPTHLLAAGTPPKEIVEHVGGPSTGTDALSIALMHSPVGWTEPAQTPDFDEWSVVLRGALVVAHDAGKLTVRAGQAVHVAAGERVRYATPDAETEYVSMCMPAFSPERVHRDPTPVAD